MEYKIIDKNVWKTPLCYFNCESCFLSNIVPCHVYAKIVSTTSLEYITRIILYIVLHSSIQQLIYIQYKINSSRCPSIEVENCILSDNCEMNYMIIDSATYGCHYIDGVCVYNNYQCFQETEYNHISHMIFLASMFFYIVLSYLHYSARMYLKKVKNIESSSTEDCCASTLCSTCGLAQEFRELV